jgi:hypothetical protein
VFELDDFVFDAEFLALQVVEDIFVGERAVDFLIDGVLQGAMTGPEGLDTILQRHGSSLEKVGAADPSMLTPIGAPYQAGYAHARSDLPGRFSPGR